MAGERQCYENCIASMSGGDASCASRTCQARKASYKDSCTQQCSYNVMSGNDSCMQRCETEAQMRPICYGSNCKNENKRILDQCRSQCRGPGGMAASGAPLGNMCQMQCGPLLQQQSSCNNDYGCMQQLQNKYMDCMNKCSGGQMPYNPMGASTGAMMNSYGMQSYNGIQSPSNMQPQMSMNSDGYGQMAGNWGYIPYNMMSYGYYNY